MSPPELPWACRCHHYFQRLPELVGVPQIKHKKWKLNNWEVDNFLTSSCISSWCYSMRCLILAYAIAFPFLHCFKFIHWKDCRYMFALGFSIVSFYSCIWGMRSCIKHQEPFLKFEFILLPRNLFFPQIYELKNYFYPKFTCSKMTFIIVNKRSLNLLLTYCYKNIQFL